MFMHLPQNPSSSNIHRSSLTHSLLPCISNQFSLSLSLNRDANVVCMHMKTEITTGRKLSLWCWHLMCFSNEKPFCVAVFWLTFVIRFHIFGTLLKPHKIFVFFFCSYVCVWLFSFLWHFLRLSIYCTP